MDLFALGEIVKTRGLRGCLKVLCYVETKNIFSDLTFVYIEQPSGQKNRFEIKKIDLSGNVLFIELDGIPDVESAKALVGRKVFLPVDMQEKLPEGEYYQRVEAVRGEFGVYIVSDGNKNPFRMKFRSPNFSNLAALHQMSKDQKIADLVAISGSLDFVVPDMDR